MVADVKPERISFAEGATEVLVFRAEIEMPRSFFTSRGREGTVGKFFYRHSLDGNGIWVPFSFRSNG